MTTIWNDLLNLFEPRLCQLCKKALLPEERALCLHCLCDLPRTYYHRRDDHPLLPLFTGISSFRHVTAFLFYKEGGPVQSLIHSFKYKGNKQLAERLGRIAAQELQADSFFRDVDVCIPVPLHRRRQRTRGYNQAEWIARGLAEVYHFPVDTRTLVRAVDTDTQTHKSAYERRMNVAEAFRLSRPEQLVDKHVLLVDDVLTTGATLLSCIDCLTRIPRISISVFTLAFAL